MGNLLNNHSNNTSSSSNSGGNSNIKASSRSSSIMTNRSQLSEKTQKVLKDAMRHGIKDGYLDLASKCRGVYDSMVPELCEWICKLGDKVKKFRLHGNGITSLGACMIFDILRESNSITEGIVLSSNSNINDTCMKSLGEYIKSNQSIKEISLECTQITDKGIEILVPYLEGNVTFKRLDLDSNKGITNKSIPFLVKIIESSMVDDINIAFTSIADKSVLVLPLIHKGLQNGASSLCICENRNINDKVLIKLCEYMNKYGIDKLKEIEFSFNMVRSKGASTLFKTLKECNSMVSYLSLSNNQIDDECMKQLGEFVQDNLYLEKLCIDDNRITDKGIEILSEHLIGNMTLKYLDVHGNESVTEASTPILVEIAKRSHIIKIESWDTSISEDKQKEIEDAFNISVDQREIPIKSNSKSAAKISSSTSTEST